MAAFGVLFVFVLNAFLAAIAFYNFYWKRRKLPPGPTPLPIFGNTLTILANPTGEPQFRRWAKEYGPVYTFWLGERPVVFMTDYAQIVDTFIKDGESYTGRTLFTKVDPRYRKDGILGVVFSDGQLWRDHRRFALHVFRDFGVGKSVMEQKILTEIGERFATVDDEIAAAGGLAKELDLLAVLDITVGSIINDLIFGFRFVGEQAAEFRELKYCMRELMEHASHPLAEPLNICPDLLKWLPYFHGVFQGITRNFDQLDRFYRRHIDAHADHMAAAGDADSPVTDYVSAFVREREYRRAAGDEGGVENFSDSQLICMCLDLWLAGQETTSNTLGWGVALILHNPEVQSRLHAELDAVIGDPDRLVTLAERADLPYTQAVANEIQRVSNILPVNLLHRTTRDVTIGGHLIERGTIITPQICAVLSDEQYFSDADTFDPSRFLDADGKLAKCDQFIPFGVGKRQCLGEPLARMELFLIVANLYNRYEVLPSGGLPSLKRSLEGIVAPKPYRCALRRRAKI